MVKWSNVVYAWSVVLSVVCAVFWVAEGKALIQWVDGGTRGAREYS